MNKRLFFLIFLAIIFCGESVSSGAMGQAASGPQLAKDCAEALNKNNYPQAEACNEKLLLMYPGQKALYYNLAIAQYNQRKYEEAAGNLYKAIDLGIAANPQLEMSLRPYKLRKFSRNIAQRYVLNFEGTSNCSEKLIADILPGLDGLSGGFGKTVLIRPKFLQWSPGGKFWQEEWLVEGKSGPKTFTLTLTPTPDGGTDFSVKEKKT